MNKYDKINEVYEKIIKSENKINEAGSDTAKFIHGLFWHLKNWKYLDPDRIQKSSSGKKVFAIPTKKGISDSDAQKMVSDLTKILGSKGGLVEYDPETNYIYVREKK